jgi:hypothetical protein
MALNGSFWTNLLNLALNNYGLETLPAGSDAIPSLLLSMLMFLKWLLFVMAIPIQSFVDAVN